MTTRSCGSRRASSHCLSKAARCSIGSRCHRVRSSENLLFRIARYDLRETWTAAPSSASKISRSFGGSRWRSGPRSTSFSRSSRSRAATLTSFGASPATSSFSSRCCRCCKRRPRRPRTRSRRRAVRRRIESRVARPDRRSSPGCRSSSRRSSSTSPIARAPVVAASCACGLASSTSRR